MRGEQRIVARSTASVCGAPRQSKRRRARGLWAEGARTRCGEGRRRCAEHGSRRAQSRVDRGGEPAAEERAA
eukprot:4516100-Prymnesium_polylepis.1